MQERGGPCGVMAAVQGALLQTLHFGSRLEGGGGCKVSGNLSTELIYRVTHLVSKKTSR